MSIIRRVLIIFIKKHLVSLLGIDEGRNIDTILLACTHYPLLEGKIKEYLPSGVKVVSQGGIIAESLADYLKRHPEIEEQCSKSGDRRFFTTDSTTDFDHHATQFFGSAVVSEHLSL